VAPVVNKALSSILGIAKNLNNEMKVQKYYSFGSFMANRAQKQGIIHNITYSLSVVTNTVEFNIFLTDKYGILSTEKPSEIKQRT
jgi:hypothetical protein